MSMQETQIRSPFARLRELLGDAPPGIEPAIDLTLGAPRHPMPAFIRAELAKRHSLYNNYPPIRPIDELARALDGWFERRYGLGGKLDAKTMTLPLLGSREGLFSAIFTARDRARGKTKDWAKQSRGADGETQAALIPNPFYQVYAAAAAAAGLEAVYLDAPRENGFLPDLERLAADKQLLARTSVFYLCTPSNPQGAVASKAYLQQAIELARAYDFMIFADECYSEIYYEQPPAGALQVAFELSGDFSRVVSFNSLSKRSNLPGLRSGFVAGDQDFINDYAQFRNVACPQMPLPVQHASALAWADEDHVEQNRKLYIEKINLSVEILNQRFQVEKPAGGFFLWLNMSDLGGGEAATERLWKGCGVKVLPGAYLAKEGLGAREEAVNVNANPASADVRIALVSSLETTRKAMKRMVSVE